MEFIEIYGTKVYLPSPPQLNIIDGHDLPKEEQYWRRRELPEIFDDVSFDKDGNAILNEFEKEYARIEVERCKRGYWFYNNGTPTYITGQNYFHLQWWKLEDDIHADYRDADRRYFVF